MYGDEPTEKALLLKDSSGHFGKNITYSAGVKSPLKSSDYKEDTNLDDNDDEDGDVDQSELKIVIQQDRSFMKHTTTNMQALMHILKGSIGTGILALPNAFLSAGLWVGFGGVLVIGAITVHCIHMLVTSSHTLCARSNSVALDYAMTAEMAFKTGPMRLRRGAKAARLVVNGFLVVIQIGTCCAYIVFVADNVKQVVNHFHSNDPDTRIYMVIVMAFLIPYVCIKYLTVLSIFTGFANILTVVGLVIIFQYIVRGLPDQSARPAFNSIGTLPFFLGTALFAFEGIAVVLPVENTMKYPRELLGWNGILNLGMVTVVSLYTAVGFYGYLNMGERVRASITLSLPVENWLYLSVRLLFAVSIFISYGLQYYVSIQIIWPLLRNRITSHRWQVLVEYILRILIVLFTLGVAVGIPHLDLLISLIGAFFSSCLALTFPAIIEFITLYGEGRRPPIYTIVKDILIISLGVVAFIFGTYTSVKSIVETF